MIRDGHDDLCPVARESWCLWPGDKCDKCRLIRKVRADERARWQPLTPMTPQHAAFCWCTACKREAGA